MSSASLEDVWGDEIADTSAFASPASSHGLAKSSVDDVISARLQSSQKTGQMPHDVGGDVPLHSNDALRAEFAERLSGILIAVLGVAMVTFVQMERLHRELRLLRQVVHPHL